MNGGYALDLLPSFIKERPKDFFALNLAWDATGLAAAATVPRSVQVNADADFLVVALTGIIFNATLVTVPATNPVTVVIEDDGSGRRFMNQAALWDDIIGTAQRPGILPYPKLVPRSSTITITLANRDAANAFDVFVSLVGFKIFGAPLEF